MVGLGCLPGHSQSVALGVSGDGSVVVGYSVGYNASDPYSEVFIWDEKNGMRNLKDLLGVGGLDLNGWVLERATGISADGYTIVGSGTSPNGIPQGWIANLEPPPVVKRNGMPWILLLLDK
jgi:uncharacterized membrane protein